MVRYLKNPFLPVAETVDTHFSGVKRQSAKQIHFSSVSGKPWCFSKPCLSSFRKLPRSVQHSLSGYGRKTKHRVPSYAPVRASLSVPQHPVHNATNISTFCAFPILNAFVEKAEQNDGHFYIASMMHCCHKEESHDNSMPSSVHFIQGMCRDSASHQSGLMSIAENNSALLMEWPVVKNDVTSPCVFEKHPLWLRSCRMVACFLKQVWRELVRSALIWCSSCAGR